MQSPSSQSQIQILTENSWWSKLKTSIAMNLFSILIQELNLIPDFLAKEHHTQRYLDVLLTTNPISFASKMQLCMTFLTEKYRLKPWLKKILKALERSVHSVAAKVLEEKENQGESQTIRYLELFQNQFQKPLFEAISLDIQCVTQPDAQSLRDSLKFYYENLIRTLSNQYEVDSNGSSFLNILRKEIPTLDTSMYSMRVAKAMVEFAGTFQPVAHSSNLQNPLELLGLTEEFIKEFIHRIYQTSYTVFGKWMQQENPLL